MVAPHVDERLTERAAPAVADRGYELLRDPERLETFLMEQAKVHSGVQQAARVALPLSGDEHPAHLLVERTGHGVTCLSPHMRFDVPALPWVAVNGYLKDQRARLDQAVALGKARDDQATTFTRATRFAYRMGRLDFDTWRVLAPLHLPWTLNRIDQQLTAMQDLRRKPLLRRMPQERLEEMWRAYSSAWVGLMAVGHEEESTRICLLAAIAGDVMLATRGLWWLVNKPERTMNLLDELLATVWQPGYSAPEGKHPLEDPETTWMLTAPPLILMALRFSYLRNNAFDMLKRIGALLHLEERVRGMVAATKNVCSACPAISASLCRI